MRSWLVGGVANTVGWRCFTPRGRLPGEGGRAGEGGPERGRKAPGAQAGREQRASRASKLTNKKWGRACEQEASAQVHSDSVSAQALPFRQALHESVEQLGEGAGG